MITIRNINPNLGDVETTFAQENLQSTMDEMSQVVRDCGYECIEVCEGVLFTGHEADIAANESDPYIATPTDKFIADEAALPENPGFRRLFGF